MKFFPWLSVKKQTQITILNGIICRIRTSMHIESAPQVLWSYPMGRWAYRTSPMTIQMTAQYSLLNWLRHIETIMDLCEKSGDHKHYRSSVQQFHFEPNVSLSIQKWKETSTGNSSGTTVAVWTKVVDRPTEPETLVWNIYDVCSFKFEYMQNMIVCRCWCWTFNCGMN